MRNGVVSLKSFNTFETNWGIGATVFSEKGLCGIVLPQQDDVYLIDEINRRFGECDYDKRIGYRLSLALERYFAGERIHFDIQVDCAKATDFEKAVYEQLKDVPYGKTISYRALAERCGRPGAARAVGNAMMKNKALIVVPCHRVLKSDGGIGGWSGLPGWKERLLEIEGTLSPSLDGRG